MKTRAEAAALVNQQLDGPVAGQRNRWASQTPLLGRNKGHCHHYGKQELRELLDFIYGGEPKTEAEKIVGDKL